MPILVFPFGGVALQAHLAEPRTILDIDITVAADGQIPCVQLEAADFTWTGRFGHPENWLGPEETPVQFADDPALAEAVKRAEEIECEGGRTLPMRNHSLSRPRLWCENSAPSNTLNASLLFGPSDV